MYVGLKLACTIKKAEETCLYNMEQVEAILLQDIADVGINKLYGDYELIVEIDENRKLEVSVYGWDREVDVVDIRKYLRDKLELLIHHDSVSFSLYADDDLDHPSGSWVEDNFFAQIED